MYFNIFPLTSVLSYQRFHQFFLSYLHFLALLWKVSRIIDPKENYPSDNCPLRNYTLDDTPGIFAPGQLPLRKIAPEENCPLTIKFPLK